MRMRVTLAAQEIRRPLHRPREDKVQISRDREVLMRMRVTLAAEELGGSHTAAGGLGLNIT
jgi:hypothetical protein